jgi:acyl-CoA synthetase (AMP-forming)/AMP-acid ligase II
VNHLGPVLEFARPATIGRLRRAGALQPTGLLGLAGALPWLLGRGPSLGVLSRVQGIANAPKPAVIDRAGTVAWRDLDRRSDRAARALDAEGIGPGDGVALLLRNGREFVETLVAAQKIGATACPLNTWAGRGELGAALEDLAPAALVYDVRHTEQLHPVVPSGTSLIAVGDDPAGSLPGAESYEGVLAAQAPGPLGPMARRRGPPKIVIQTSGTTGRPKGAAREGSGRGLGGLSALLERIPFRADDVMVCPAPLFHAFGLLNVTLAMLLGSTLVLPDAYDPEGTLALIERHRATSCSLVPVMLHRILSLPEEARRSHDLGSLRVLLVSGSALPPDLRERATETFGDVIYDLYGSTEAGWVAVATPEDARGRPGSVGRPVEGVEVSILDPAGRALPAGDHGEIHVRSEARFEGYVSGGEDREREGLFPLGDVGWLDDEGFLHVEGRADDMAVVGGENVYPAEVEAVIRAVDGVEDVAVAGIPDQEYGQALAAFVVGPADPDAVVEACRRDLASFKVPRRVERIDELPRTATGKVRLNALVERIEKE